MTTARREAEREGRERGREGENGRKKAEWECKERNRHLIKSIGFPPKKVVQNKLFFKEGKNQLMF